MPLAEESLELARSPEEVVGYLRGAVAADGSFDQPILADMFAGLVDQGRAGRASVFDREEKTAEGDAE